MPTKLVESDTFIFSFDDCNEIPDYTVKDISQEKYRKYYFDSGHAIMVDKPIAVYIKQSDNGKTHRVVNVVGQVLWITNFVAIEWENKEGNGRMLF